MNMLSSLSIYSAMFALGLLPSVTHVNGKTKQQIGEITFEGANAFTIKDLLAIAGVKPKKDFRRETIESIRHRIRNAYLERGFIKAEISVSLDSPAQQASGKKDRVKLKVTIYEGPRYFLCGTEVMGNKMTNHGVVMRAAGLRMGPYNPNRIDKWVEGLNRLGRFEPVRREDIVIDLNESEHCADVLFQLKEKPGLKIRRH